MRRVCPPAILSAGGRLHKMLKSERLTHDWNFIEMFGLNKRTHAKDLYTVRLTAASTLAGESPFGSASIEITLIMMVSTVWIGSQRSSGFS